jgi:hypothetical protein
MLYSVSRKYPIQWGPGVARWLSAALLVRGSRDRFPLVSLEIFSVATDGIMSTQPLKNEY